MSIAGNRSRIPLVNISGCRLLGIQALRRRRGYCVAIVTAVTNLCLSTIDLNEVASEALVLFVFLTCQCYVTPLFHPLAPRFAPGCASCALIQIACMVSRKADQPDQ